MTRGHEAGRCDRSASPSKPPASYWASPAATDAGGFAAHAADAAVNWSTAGAFTAAAIAGSLAAAKVAIRVPAERLRRAFAYVVFAVALFVVVQVDVSAPAVGALGGLRWPREAAGWTLAVKGATT